MTERKTTDTALLSRILGFEIDPPEQPGAFLERLVAETGWTTAEAHSTILEYRRFLYLAAVSTNGATPSRKIDEVWHQHLLFTRNYERMCREAIGRTLHHDPGTSAADEERYRQLYLDTLASYEREFGVPPPEDCWPLPGTRTARPALDERNKEKSILTSFSFLGGSTVALAGISIADSYPGIYMTALIAFLGFFAAKLFGGSGHDPAQHEGSSRRRGQETTSTSDGGGPVYAAGACGASGMNGGSDGGSDGGSSGGDGGGSCGGGGCGGGCGG